jgi:hypothetical protein
MDPPSPYLPLELHLACGHTPLLCSQLFIRTDRTWARVHRHTHTNTQKHTRTQRALPAEERKLFHSHPEQPLRPLEATHEHKLPVAE